VSYLGDSLLEMEITAVVVKDAVCVVAGIVFVGLYLFFHTRSGFLTAMGLVQMLVSFPVAFVLYRLYAHWTGPLNLMGVFFALGIVVDDILVFTDTWHNMVLKHSRKYSKHSSSKYSTSSSSSSKDGMKRVLSATLRRAGSAMLVTSVTDIFAFLSNVVSPVSPVQDFGVFMGLLVATNYALVMTWYAFAVVVHHTYPSVCCCCCSKRRSRSRSRSRRSKQSSLRASEDGLFFSLPSTDKDTDNQDSTRTTAAAGGGAGGAAAAAAAGAAAADGG